MRKIETIFITISLLLAVGIVGGLITRYDNNGDAGHIVASEYKFPDRQFGSFLAAQHAIYVNDFESAGGFADKLQDVQYPIVQNTKMISEFLNGYLPQDAKLLKQEKGMPAKLVYDAYLITNNRWKDFHNRHKSDEGALLAPLRIWSAIANDWRTNTFKFIDKLPTNDSWKSFIRGQIYAELGDIDKAAEHFALVKPDFMNINDYLYLMSFYLHHDMTEDAKILREDFTARPGGMFLIDFDDFPDWSVYSGFKNALAFSLVQNVSHTQILMYSDLAMILLRFAQIIAPEFSASNNVIDYYMGQYYFKNIGNWSDCFSRVSSNSPFYLFAKMRVAEKTGDITHLKEVLKHSSLFVPAINKLMGHYIRNGNRRAALNVVKNTLSVDDLPENMRAFFTKGRAQINYSFGNYESAQSDIDYVLSVLPSDAEALSMQARIWAAQNKEIEKAYNYAMLLIRNNPADVYAWDTLGRVVAAREGADVALDLLSRVGDVSEKCSSLFETLGDLYVSTGDMERAKQSYLRAIELSDDGLVVVPHIKKKLRKIK